MRSILKRHSSRFPVLSKEAELTPQQYPALMARDAPDLNLIIVSAIGPTAQIAPFSQRGPLTSVSSHKNWLLVSGLHRKHII